MVELHTHGTLNETFEINDSLGFIDLFYYDGERSGIVTFLRIDKLLYDEWELNGEEFDLENVTKPGIHRDDEIYDDGDPNNYTIVVDLPFLKSEDLLEEKIEELNEKYDENFEINWEADTFDRHQEWLENNPEEKKKHEEKIKEMRKNHEEMMEKLE